MNVEVKVEEEWIVEDWRDNVLHYTVWAVNDRDECTSVDAWEENTFTKDATTICDSWLCDWNVVEEKGAWDDFDIWEWFVDLKWEKEEEVEVSEDIFK